ncbi:hypothetical protein AOLI_G00145180, partial [Acnodon oligacanthus]
TSHHYFVDTFLLSLCKSLRRDRGLITLPGAEAAEGSVRSFKKKKKKKKKNATHRVTLTGDLVQINLVIPRNTHSYPSTSRCFAVETHISDMLACTRHQDRSLTYLLCKTDTGSDRLCQRKTRNK